MQNLLNLLYREEEKEMLPLCRAEGIGVIPWSPLAKGRLTRDWDETTARSENDEAGSRLAAGMADSDRKIVEKVAEIAAKRGITRAQVALAWVLQKQPVTAPIIGATKMNHLEDAVAALSVKLDSNEIASLEEPYVPHRVFGM
jgi:1-deoxyxylulose-5-phosphate synthase